MLNKVVLMGRFAADPELRKTPNGVSVLSFTLAVQRNFAGADGQRATDWIDCIAWRQTAEFISRYFRKGNLVAVDGALMTRTYQDKNGNNRKAVEVQVDNAYFVESKNSQSGSSASAPIAAEAPAQKTAEPVSYSSGNFDDFEEIIPDDDLPF